MSTLTNKWIQQLDMSGYQLRFTLPGECIDDCSAPGDVDEAVEWWVRRLEFDADPTATREYLRTFGAWDEDELADHACNVERLLWSIACDLREEYLGDHLGADARRDGDIEYAMEPELNPER